MGYVINSHIPLAQLFYSFPRLFFKSRAHKTKVARTRLRKTKTQGMEYNYMIYDSSLRC